MIAVTIINVSHGDVDSSTGRDADRKAHETGREPNFAGDDSVDDMLSFHNTLSHSVKLEVADQHRIAHQYSES